MLPADDGSLTGAYQWRSEMHCVSFTRATLCDTQCGSVSVCLSVCLSVQSVSHTPVFNGNGCMDRPFIA